MIRTFAAISIPARILESIEVAAARLKELRLDARYTKASSIHLTLKFLGDIDESLVEGISNALEESTRTIGRFSLTVEGMGVFPSRKKPRIVWVGVGAEAELANLQQRVETNLELLGFEAEKRPFKPHLTLARIKSWRNLSQLQHFLERGGAGFTLGSFDVDEIHLYQSILRPDGAEYRQLSTHALGTGN